MSIDIGVEVEDIPKLEGYVTFPEAADILGVTKQMVHKMAFDSQDFTTLRAVGSRPLYVIKTAEVEEFHRHREKAHQEREQLKRDREERRALRIAAREARKSRV